MTEQEQLTIELPFGYQSKDGALHKRVVFGKRPTGEDLVRLTSDRQSEVNTQFQLLFQRTSIVEFGSLMKRGMSVPLTTLLALNRADRDALAETHAEFLQTTLEGRSTEALSESAFRLAFGLEVGGEVFDVVEFGNLPTGADEVRIDKSQTGSWHRGLLMLEAQIVKLSQSEGSAVNNGVEMETMLRADWFDLEAMNEGAQAWMNSFRTKTKRVANANS